MNEATRKACFGLFVGLLAGALIGPLSSSSVAADWPMFHRDIMNLGATDDLGPDSETILWRVEAHEDVNCSPAVADGRVYFTDELGHVICADQGTGELIWDVDIGTKIDAGPAIWENKVYIGDGWNGDKLCCLHADTGAEVWCSDETTAYGYDDWVASPVVVDGKVYAGTLDQYFHCIDADSGDQIWVFHAGGGVYCSAAVDTTGGNDLVYFAAHDSLFCLPMDDPTPTDENEVDGSTIEDRDVVWRYCTPDRSFLECAPALHGGHVYFASDAGSVYCLDAADGSEVWQVDIDEWAFLGSSPAIANIGTTADPVWRLYIGSLNGILYCLDPASGDTVWSYKTEGQIYGSPAVSHDKVYFCGGTHDWSLHCLDAATGGQIWEETWYSFENSSPAIVDGVLYVGVAGGSRTGERLFAYAEDQSVTTSSAHLFNDGFPATGVIDTTNLAFNSVRLDMARNISPPGHLRNDPGDSIVVDVSLPYLGAEATDVPTLYYQLHRNLLFDPYRGSMPAVGAVPADTCYVGTVPVPGRFTFDFPDTGFFFPGDILHFYFNYPFAIPGFADSDTCPSDLAGYGVFPGDEGWSPLHWNRRYEVRALPTLSTNQSGFYVQPPILLWMDGGRMDETDDWTFMLGSLGLREGVDFDIYRTRNGVNLGNGLGGRATSEQIAGYETILYTCGTQRTATINVLNFDADTSDDLGLMNSWLDDGGRNLLVCGDNLASDLDVTIPEGQAFLARIGVQLEGPDLYTHLGTWTPTADNLSVGGVDLTLTPLNWTVYGLDYRRTFDIVTPIAPATSLAEFQSTSGYSAMILKEESIPETGSNKLVALPYDLGAVQLAQDPGPEPEAPRLVLLRDILHYFGYQTVGPIVDVTPPQMFRIAAHPNPFNPTVRIDFEMPASGRLEIEIFDLLGRKLRTVLDEVRGTGPGYVTWDGRDGDGRQLATGTYLCRSRTGGDTRTLKMMLLR